MTPGTPDREDLLRMWTALAAVSSGERLYRTRRLEREGALDLRVGCRETDGAPCLLAVTDGADASAIATFETGGLRLSRALDHESVLLVLSLEEPKRRDLFAQVCADLLRSADKARPEAPQAGLRELAERLAAWRFFLRDRQAALQLHDLVGIAGELVMLQRLLADGVDAVGAWRSPDDGLFDFQESGRAVEIKTTLGSGSRLHISSLDQLDDQGLTELTLVHVRLAEDADGKGIIPLSTEIEATLPEDRARRAFANALLRRGLPPDADERLEPFFRVVSLRPFRVTAEFPRLLRADVPAAIVEAGYDLDLRGLAGFAVSEEEMVAGFRRRTDG